MAHLEPFLTREALQARIAELGKQLTADYAGKRVTAVGILKGSILFLADLVREMDLDVDIEFLGVSSYHGTESTGVVRITHDLHASIEGKEVLLIEDIVDTGLTLSFLRQTLELRNPKSLKVVALLDKPSRRQVPVEVDYIGFPIPDAFVVGYGLDLDQRYRNVPYVAIYRPDAS
jgi:hypoxanthine phosphoribosyltransferase